MARESITSDMTAAMKAGDKVKVGTLRMLMSAIKNEEIAVGGELDEQAFLKLVRKQIKQRKESAEQYEKGGRAELAAQETREAEILGVYLPPAVDDDEIRKALRDFVAAEGLSGPSAIGPIMKAMLARFGGQADGATINRLAREILAEAD